MSKSTIATAGGRRFWVTVLCFAVLNAATWVSYIQWQRVHRHQLLEITQFSPGDGAQLVGRQTFYWSFNLDVAPQKAGGPPPGTITPAVAGKWEWTDARNLKFTPDQALPRATPISIALSSEAIRTPDGFRLGKPFVAALHTVPLEVIESRQIAFDAGDRVILEMKFNDKVLPADLGRYLKIETPGGKPILFHPHGEAAGAKVRIITDPIPALESADSSVKVLAIDMRIGKGLAGQAGPLGLADDYRSRVTVAPDVVATDASAYFPSHDEPFLQVRFNNAVDGEKIKSLISVSPPVAFTLSTGNSGVDLHGPFQPGTRYAIKLAKPPAGVSARLLPRPTSLSVLVPDRDAGLWFESEVGYLSAEGNRTVMAHAVNMTDLRATVTRVYDNNLVAWRNESHRGGYWRNVDAFSRPVAVQDFHLPVKKNEQQDIRLSLDDLLPAGEARDGVYRISLRSTEPNAPRPRWTNEDADEDSDDAGGYYGGGVSTMVTLSDIGLSANQGRDGIIVWATSLRTAKPLANIHARIFSNKSQLLGEATTNASGLATIIPLPAGPGEKATVLIADEPPSVEVRQPADDVDASPQARRAGAHLAGSKSPAEGLTWLDLNEGAVNFGDADVAGRAYLRHGFEAFVYTDRGVYRPGETVHLRAIVRGADNAVPQRFPVRWQIRRPDLRDWKMQMAEIDADGATSFDLELPTDLPSGRWTAHVGLPGEAGSAARFFGTVAFDIEDFMPQRMKVNVDFDDAGKNGAKDTGRLTLGDEPIPAHVQADYLFGRPVTERPATMVARIDPISFRPKGFAGWTFGDDANTAQPLGRANPLGHRSELTAAQLDAKGHAKWDIDVSDLIENGQAQDEDAGAATLASSRHRASRRSARHVAPAQDKNADGDYAGPWRLSITGSVSEAGGRAITASRQIEVDRAAYYIGLKSRETSQRPGVACTFDAQLITPAGKLSATDATLQFTLYRETWNSSYVYENSHYRFHSTRILEPVGGDAHDVNITKGKGEISITPPGGGSYILLAHDGQTGVTTSLGFYAGYGIWEDNISRQNPEKLDLLIQPMPVETLLDGALSAIGHWDLPALADLPNRVTPLPPRDGKLHFGQTAQVIVRSPFAGKLLLAVETDGVVSTQVLDMPENHIAVPIDIPESCRPNAYVSASVIRPIDPNAKWSIHRAIGVARLNVDNDDRKLTIQLAAPVEIRPQASLGVQLRVLDSAGNAVPNAAVTVAAVDEGICQLTDFKTPDPFGFFTATRALGVHSADLFGQLMPETPMAEKQSAVGGDDGSAFGLKRGSPVGAKRVRPVALVSRVLHTDATGIARADFPTPEFNGLLRVMAVASAPGGFGSGDVPVLVRSPVLVQSSWPRFAAPTDRFTVPLTVFNNGPRVGEVNIRVQVDGPIAIADGKGQPGENGQTGLEKIALAPLSIQPGGQATVGFNIIAQDRIGVAHAHLIAKMGDELFEENIELPIRPGSPTVTETGYVAVKPGTPVTVQVPSGFVEGTIHYELHVNSTRQLQLPQGLDYLDHYPYGCLEQTTSTLFPLVYLNDVGEQISPGMFNKDRVADKVQVGLLRMLSMQTSDGGLAMWPGGREAWPWGSVYAAHFLVEAQSAGYEIPEELRDPLLTYVRTLLNQPEESGAVIELQSYACYVLSLAGKPLRPVMGRLTEVIKNEEAGSARFHLAAAWLAAGRRDLAAGLIPAAIPAARTNRDLSGNVGSAIRDRAVLISTMLAVDAEDPRIGNLVQQLADSGRAHQWRSTQDTAFAVMTIGQYLHHARTQTPFEKAVLELDGKRIGESYESMPLYFFSRSPLSQEEMKSPDAAANSGQNIKLATAQKFQQPPPAGSKLRVSITGAPNAVGYVEWLETGVRTTPPASADNGMTIRRRYLDEHGKPLDAMQVHSGDLVQIELTVQAADAMDNIVIEDLLPAGLEIENPRLAGNAAGAVTAPRRRVVRDDDNANPAAPAFDGVRTDMRDDRLILVGHLTRGAAGTYLYTARAVTAGKYVLPPVKAECMYDSGVNSLWGAGTFEVLPAGAMKIAQAGE